jgi:hypothetical protein
MFGALCQFLLSLLVQLLSWFGISFGAPVKEQEQALAQAQEQKQDEPEQPSSSGPEPYSAESSQALP